MKKLIFNVFLCGALCTACIFFFSCTMFTTSLAKGARRNQKNMLKNLSASDLIAFSKDPYAADPKTVSAILELLGTDKGELKSLPLEDKEQVLTLLPEVSLPMKSIKAIAEDAREMMNEGTTEEQGKKFVEKLMDNVQSIDTAAASTLLSDGDVMKNADPGKLATGAVTLMMQVVKNVGYETVKNNVSTSGGSIDFKNDMADDIITKMLGASGSASDREAFKAAVSAAKLLSGDSQVKDSDGKPVDRVITPSEVKVYGISLGDILKSF